jgi:hypothetical protein
MGIDIVSSTIAQRSVKQLANSLADRPQAQDVSANRKSQTEHPTRADTDTTHSNGHRKAPKSNNDYKLLLFAPLPS